ncbi:MAG TPA: hypothetical protein DCP90_05630 [Clostridiales bacterium]|nr:MAG: hypothetical protein A2Y22_05045 [Clostridiales bacterium GWD2_32_59]HAN10082.1 hypothetical protein [Clostridiales bacterium]
MNSSIVGYHNINILYVDSSQRRRRLLGDLFLSSFNFLFITSEYKQLMKIFLENSERIDLIVLEMDYDIEEKIEIINQIKSKNEFVSVILLSESIDKNQVLSIINMGVSRLIIDSKDRTHFIKEFYEVCPEINIKHELRTLNKIYEYNNNGLENSEKLIRDIDDKNEFAIIVINVDKFRKINEYYGYDAGNDISNQIINRLISFIPSNNLFKIYKLQVNEYAVLIRKEIALFDFNNFAKYLYDELCEKEYLHKNIAINIVVSMGIAINTHMGNDSDILQNANFALEYAKNHDEKFTIYINELKNFSEDNFEIVSIIKSAINNDKIRVFYQPVVNNNTQEIEKYEALVRIEDEGGNIYAPITFLGIAKQVKLYPYLTKTVIEKTFKRFSNLPYSVSINLSASDMTNEDIKEFILLKLNEYPQLQNRIIFEVLETESISNYESISSFLAEIKKFGCKISIDDFGTGYSNFFNILKLEVDTIKIDASIIRNIVSDRNAQVITKAIVSFAKELNIELVAEYVSDKEIFEKVKELGIDYSQGYYFGKPEPMSDI